MKKFKKASFILMLMLVPLMLTGCGSSQSSQMVSEQDDSEGETKQKTVDVQFLRGQVSQSAGLLTMPVLLKDTGTNDTVVSSRNFTLTIQGHDFKPFKITNTPADFHENLSSSGVFEDTLSFYLGTKLTTKQLKLIKLIYTMDNGKKKIAKTMSASTDQSNTENSIVDSMTKIGDYYQDITKYIKDDNENSSLEDEFNDADYDKFKMWVLVNKQDSKNIILQVYNQTNTDIAIPFSEIELVDKTGDEFQVDPDYRRNYLCIPHGKFEVITIPLEAKPNMAKAPFTMRVRPSQTSATGSNNNFISTKKSYYPIECVVTDAKDISKAFSLTPDQYVKNNITWSKPVLNFKDRTFKCTVQLSDLFFLRADRAKYSLVGIDDDGTEGDEEIPKDVQPLKVNSDSPTQIDMRFGNLKLLKTYKHIELRYNNKKLMKVK